MMLHDTELLDSTNNTNGWKVFLLGINQNINNGNINFKKGVRTKATI